MGWKERIKKGVNAVRDSEITKEAWKGVKGELIEVMKGDEPKPRRRRKQSSKKLPKPKSEWEPEPTNPKLARLIQSIEQFVPRNVDKGGELKLQGQLQNFLTLGGWQVQLGRKLGKPLDLLVDGIVVECKVHLNESEADRLHGQVKSFLQTFRTVVVYLYHPSERGLRHFKDFGDTEGVSTVVK